MNQQSLQHQVVLVTGSGSGIGRGIAIEFAKAGADVVLAGRTLPKLEETAREIKTSGNRSLCVQTDTALSTSVDNLVHTALNEFGKIDVLVNNAAIQDAGKAMLDFSENDWDRVIDTNLKGYFLCARAVGKTMVERKRGVIINIASITAFAPPAKGGIYNISKAGVVMLTKVLARQLAGHNIRVNGVAPGYTRTPMTERVLSDPDLLSQVQAFIPLGRMAEPSDIAGSCLFLASDSARHITGHTIVVDGGQLLQYKYGID